MTRFPVLLMGLSIGCATATASTPIAMNGQAQVVIVVADDASSVERYAATELASHLQQMTGASFELVNSAAYDGAARPGIFVGAGAALAAYPEVARSIQPLGHEGVYLKTYDRNLVLTGAGGADRGTLYAVYTFLDELGVRWWSPDETYVPDNAELTVSDINIRHIPTLEYREIYAHDATNHDWAVRNRTSGSFVSAPIPAEKGGQLRYALSPAGHNHTFNLFVPHEEYFKTHPQWFSEINGQRFAAGESQLCLTNPELLAFMKQEIRRVASELPADTDSIISVSQNDNSSSCQCARCLAVDAEEGSPAGTVLRFVNAIADDIRDDYPRVAIDTLAYRYTRRAPKLVRPRDNVIVRLCNIECSFAQPLTDPANRDFASDIRAWSKISKRLYIWDYTTNFVNYVHPHPNLSVLGPNIRFFVQHNVRGIFEQDNMNSRGGDFAVLKQWVLAQLLWNPALDGNELIQQFVREYYAEAAPEVAEYIRLREAAPGRAHVGYTDSYDAPWLTPELLARSYELLQQAKAKVADDPALFARVEILEAPVLHGIVRNRYREQAWAALGREWPLTQSYEYYADELTRLFKTYNIIAIDERRSNVPQWLESLKFEPPVVRSIPPQIANLPSADWYDLQDHRFSIQDLNDWIARGTDPGASDGSVVIMPGGHLQWALQTGIDTVLLNARPGEPWTIYAAVRVTGNAANRSGVAFTAGVYDNATSAGIEPRLSVNFADIPDDGFHLYRIGATEMAHTKYVWMAPGGNEQVSQVIIDRLLFIRGDVDLK